MAKEGWQKAHLGEHHYQRQALRRFILGALLFGDSTLEVLRKGIRTLSTEVRIDKEEIKGHRFSAQHIQGVAIFSLNDFVLESGIRFPNHIKIDVDGVEKQIVQHMDKIILDSKL